MMLGKLPGMLLHPVGQAFHEFAEILEIAAGNADMFAAIAPMASYRVDVAGLENLVRVPVWAFHSSEDRPQSESDAIDRLSAIGGCCHFTEIAGADDNCWDAAFAEHNLLQWLLEQKRDSPCSLIDKTPWSERFISWLAAYWPQLVIGSLLVCGLLLWRRESRGRRQLPTVVADDSPSNT
jgi:hypothetical protein